MKAAPIRYLSFFSGIEAASAAWEPLGWEPVAFAEIEKFPSAVLAHRYPDVPNLGDITKLSAADIRKLGPIDIVVGGWPCQDVSVAGKRKGFRNDDGTLTRSGLFFEAIRLVRAANPRWVVFENVPGLFSSHGGRDFATVVGEVLGCTFGVPRGGWQNCGIAAGPRGRVEWAELDAQFFNLAQRRERVFFVGYFGTGWEHIPPVLLEPESMSGNPAPRREKGKDLAPTISARPTGGGGLGTDFDLDGGLIAFGGNRTEGSIDVAAGFNAKGGSGRMDFESETFTAHTLRGEGFDAGEDGTGRGTPLVPVAFNSTGQGYPAAVRRLTVEECEFLQGFPRGYTRIPWRGRRAEDCPDGPRYKALGNSFAVPVIAWIGERIKRQHLVNEGLPL